MLSRVGASLARPWGLSRTCTPFSRGNLRAHSLSTLNKKGGSGFRATAGRCVSGWSSERMNSALLSTAGRSAQNFFQLMKSIRTPDIEKLFDFAILQPRPPDVSAPSKATRGFARTDTTAQETQPRASRGRKRGFWRFSLYAHFLPCFVLSAGTSGVHVLNDCEFMQSLDKAGEVCS